MKLWKYRLYSIKIYGFKYIINMSNAYPMCKNYLNKKFINVKYININL